MALRRGQSSDGASRGRGRSPSLGGDRSGRTWSALRGSCATHVAHPGASIHADTFAIRTERLADEPGDRLTDVVCQAGVYLEGRAGLGRGHVS